MDAGCELLDRFLVSNRAKKRDKTRKLTTVEVAKAGSEVMVGVAAKIRAPATQVMGYLAGYAENNDDILTTDKSELMAIYRRNEHCFYAYSKTHLPFPLKPREYLACVVWESFDDGSFLVVFLFGPKVKHAHHPETADAIRISGAKVRRGRGGGGEGGHLSPVTRTSRRRLSKCSP